MTYKLLLVSLPLAGSALYLTYLHISLTRSVQCQTTPHLQDQTIRIPATVQNNTEKEYIIHHECARKSLPTTSLEHSSSSFTQEEILTLFLRHTMSTFSTRCPPAWALQSMTKAPQDKNTFAPAYIRALDFVPGDRVCSVYVVTAREGERITLSLNAPESYTGPVVDGVLVVEVKEDAGQITIVNHTVMWREKGRGSAGVLEGAVGRWMHGLMVRGLMESSVRKLVAEIGEKKGL